MTARQITVTATFTFHVDDSTTLEQFRDEYIDGRWTQPDPELQFTEQELDYPKAYNPNTLHDGYYTVVVKNEDDERIHRTFHLETNPKDSSFAPGKQILSFLMNSDNTASSSYRSMGLIQPRTGQLTLWTKYRGLGDGDTMSVIVQCAKFLVGHSDIWDKARAMYALESVRCYHCGHRLTDDTSIERHVGPTCWMKYGHEQREQEAAASV